VSPGLFQSWVESKHAQKGVHCMTCHVDHEAASRQKSMVFPEKCGECHPKALEDFKKSRHSISWDRMRTQGEFLGIPQEIRSAFCERCHIVQKRCNSCHTSHSFYAEEAREPESCKKCHTGLAGPHDEMYASSLHGTIYAAEKSLIRAPTCASCHMPKGNHNIGFGIIYDSWGNAVDIQGMPLSKEKQEKIRKEMSEEVCYQCHIKSLTRERFELAHQVKEEARKVLAEAEQVIRELEVDGILSKGLALGQNQLYQGTSRIEGLYYRMFQFHNVYTWKGAYHFSADFAHWYGWAHLQMSLIEIKEEARKLREVSKIKK